MTVTIRHETGMQDAAHEVMPEGETLTAHTTPGAVTPTGGSEPRTARSTQTPAEQMEFISLPSGELDLDGDQDDDVPLYFRTLDNMLEWGQKQEGS